MNAFSLQSSFDNLKSKIKNGWGLRSSVSKSTRTTSPADSSVDILFGQPESLYLAPHSCQFCALGFDHHGFEYDRLTLDTDFKVVSVGKFLDDRFRKRDLVFDGFFCKHI
jgi:hypothetical protein